MARKNRPDQLRARDARMMLFPAISEHEADAVRALAMRGYRTFPETAMYDPRARYWMLPLRKAAHDRLVRTHGSIGQAIAHFERLAHV